MGRPGFSFHRRESTEQGHGPCGPGTSSHPCPLPRSSSDMHKSLSCFVLSSFALLFLPAAARAQTERPQVVGSVERLAASLAVYLEARSSSLGLGEAKSALALSLDQLSKALGGDPLQYPAELGRALWLSRGHQETKERGGKVQSASFAHGSFSGAGMGYAYRLPREYDASRAYPLILAIPGIGEEPAEHIRVHWTLREIQDQVILVCPAMPAHQEDWERVMVKGRPGGLSHVLTGLRVAAERFAVDFERVFVAGYGKAVPAAVAAGNYSPQRFAGIIGQAGDAGGLRPDNFSNLPTYFAGGAAEARAFGAAAKEAGHDNSLFQADGKEQDIWIWMQAHPRRALPERVVLVPGNPFPTRAYWLQVNPSAADARATATIARGTNTIRIDAQGIAQATVFLNDKLVDLSRPVRVVCNGVEQSSDVPRQLTSFLDMLYDGTSDASAVYVARAEYDMRGEAASAALDAASEADGEYEQRLASAGNEVAQVWELHQWCASTQREWQSAQALRTILRLDPEHRRTREALGHVSHAGQWFTSAEARDRFQESQDPQAAAAKGHIEFKSLWMHPDERALAVKGWVKDQETGLWLDPTDKKRLADGWRRQDLDWIPPADGPRMDEGSWWVDGEWLDLERANRRHAQIDSMWRIPGAEVLLHSTADREVSLRAMREMGRALVDLCHVFGTEPVLPLSVGMLRDEEQYDRFAFGDPDGRRLATHAGRLQAVHSAFFAESWFPRVEGKREFQGMGICYWDTRVPNGDAYGVHAARLAVGLSYVEALDPSPKAVRKALAAGPGGDYYAAYQAEKALPAWLRWGGAVYAERFFEDTKVAADGERWWARDWSLENLKSRGGMRALSAVLAFQLDPDDRDDSLKLLLEAGAVVAFVADGGCAPVAAEHAAFKKALVSRTLEARHVKALTAAITAHERELRAFVER